ncbi:hypothetical protein ABBQ38_004933 [Trebouxia sp. C0009 RCD-2024]
MIVGPKSQVEAGGGMWGVGVAQVFQSFLYGPEEPLVGAQKKWATEAKFKSPGHQLSVVRRFSDGSFWPRVVGRNTRAMGFWKIREQTGARSAGILSWEERDLVRQQTTCDHIAAMVQKGLTTADASVSVKFVEDPHVIVAPRKKQALLGHVEALHHCGFNTGSSHAYAGTGGPADASTCTTGDKPGPADAPVGLGVFTIARRAAGSSLLHVPGVCNGLMGLYRLALDEVVCLCTVGKSH